jgi:oxalate decarboxylase/phosphoglucose isomerase-like protein (cupin superfamily)
LAGHVVGVGFWGSVPGTRVMQEGVLYRQKGALVRRMILEPGESSAWHVDNCHRVSVVLSGERLQIQFRDGGSAQEVNVAAGQVDWDAPTAEVHRAVNTGRQRYEEVVTFFLERPDQDPQPRAE